MDITDRISLAVEPKKYIFKLYIYAAMEHGMGSTTKVSRRQGQVTQIKLEPAPRKRQKTTALTLKGKGNKYTVEEGLSIHSCKRQYS